jgi:hypothetical protein
MDTVREQIGSGLLVALVVSELTSSAIGASVATDNFTIVFAIAHAVLVTAAAALIAWFAVRASETLDDHDAAHYAKNAFGLVTFALTLTQRLKDAVDEADDAGKKVAIYAGYFAIAFVAVWATIAVALGDDVGIGISAATGINIAAVALSAWRSIRFALIYCAAMLAALLTLSAFLPPDSYVFETVVIALTRGWLSACITLGYLQASDRFDASSSAIAVPGAMGCLALAAVSQVLLFWSLMFWLVPDTAPFGRWFGLMSHDPWLTGAVLLVAASPLLAQEIAERLP